MSVAVKKFIAIFAMCAALLLALGAVYTAHVNEVSGTTSASSSDVLDVKLRELSYDSTDIDANGIADMSENLVSQGSSVSVAPCIENTSTVDGWVYMVVDTPISINGDNSFVFDKSDDWTFIEQVKKDGRIQAVYGYNEVLPAGDTTEVLFDDLFYDDEVAPTLEHTIGFTACAVQAAHVDSMDDGWVLYKGKHTF